MIEPKEFREKRELNRLKLKMFASSMARNHYNDIANEQIKKLEKKLFKLKNNTKSENKTSNLEHQVNFFLVEKELFAICEMKILYAYKHFEIHLKYLLKSFYVNVKETRLYKWDLVEQFLKSKEINPKEISNYEEIRDLRNLNNAIKHSKNILGNKTKNILEFQNKETLHYKDLLQFYERIANSKIYFFNSLIDKIDKDLYIFTEERLEKISTELALRMDNKTINIFIKKIKNKY